MHLDTSLIEPLRDYCLVEIAKTDVETTSGIFISEAQAYSTPVFGTVKKAGPKSGFNPGDILFFRRYSVDELKFVTDEGDQTIFLVQTPDIVCAYKAKQSRGIMKILSAIFK